MSLFYILGYCRGCVPLGAGCVALRGRAIKRRVCRSPRG